MFIAAPSTRAKTPKQPKGPSTDDWLRKMWHIYIQWHMYYSVTKKNEILPFAATWMDPENITLSGISQTEEDS